ncbi:MAG: hypothetical protein ABUS57_22135 [Pseudomonadota bacterium]
MRIALAALFICLSLTAPARAEGPALLYATGNFRAAAEAGDRQGDVAGDIIAARALLALVVSDFRGAETGALLDRAQHCAEQALIAAPDSAPARLQLAMALGMKGRRASVTEAMKANYARRGRALIDQALKLDPHDPWAYALLGGWNLEIVRRAGALGAVFMGASLRSGVRAFDRARELAPDNPAIALHYALALLAIDPARHGAKAGDLLAVAANAAPRDAFETNVRDTARRLAAVLSSKGPMAAAETAADTFL